jgi:hypothetical protein
MVAIRKKGFLLEKHIKKEEAQFRLELLQTCRCAHLQT